MYRLASILSAIANGVAYVVFIAIAIAVTAFYANAYAHQPPACQVLGGHFGFTGWSCN